MPINRMVLFILLIFSTSFTVQADADAERTVLAQLAHELDALIPLITKAQAQANPDTRIRFQYHWLKQDINRMQRGIREHIQAPRTEPRSFPPLKGDYRR